MTVVHALKQKKENKGGKKRRKKKKKKKTCSGNENEVRIVQIVMLILIYIYIYRRMCIIYTYYVIKRIATTTAVGWTISCLWCNNIIGDRYFIVFGFFLFGRKKNRKPKEKKQ